MERLDLVPLEESHAVVFVEAVRRSQAIHHPWVEPPRTVAEFRDYVAPRGQEYFRFLAKTGDGNLIGVVNVNAITRGAFDNGCLAFYAFVPFQGLGLMRQAVLQVMAHSFQRLDLHRLEANVQPDNTRSCAFIEALGFRLEGFSPRLLRIGGQWRGHKRYALTLEDWRQCTPPSAETTCVD